MSDTTVETLTPNPAPAMDLSSVSADVLIAELTNRSQGGLFVGYSINEAGNLTYAPCWWGRLPEVVYLLGKIAHDLYAIQAVPSVAAEPVN